MLTIREKLSKAFDVFCEAYTYDSESDSLKLVNESADKKLAEIIDTVTLEKSREIWERREMMEDSFSDLEDEIDFEDSEADELGLPQRDVDPDAMEGDFDADMDADMDDEMGMSDFTESKGRKEKSLEEMLGVSDFDLNKIFEDADDDEEVGFEDGDEEFSNLKAETDDDESFADSDDDELGGEFGDSDEEGDDEELFGNEEDDLEDGFDFSSLDGDVEEIDGDSDFGDFDSEEDSLDDEVDEMMGAKHNMDECDDDEEVEL